MIGFLIEHYAGKFPVWLSPEQVRIIPITDDHNEHAKKLASELFAKGFRAEADLSSNRMNAKIRDAQNFQVPYMLVIGDQEIEHNTVSLRKRDGSRINDMAFADFVALLEDRDKSRSSEL